ncbi:hypothetical protein N1G79_004824 [Escherichia coli]|nr:hypothetical protein [Escherichia coli]EEC7356498.1 hypothetical protein [Escherichia coli]EES4346715.1 hypothetical protein [Escherichia coli]EEY7147086.1 hypothetical protein [Escherichia coli]EEY9504561.1 hypothetical protein [Escherichia coli]EFG5624242.1 hypothetical protein [Escherichia coli]
MSELLKFGAIYVVTGVIAFHILEFIDHTDSGSSAVLPFVPLHLRDFSFSFFVV